MKNTAILFFLLFLFSNTNAQYNFQNYNTKSGLSNNLVTSIAEDNQGNIWVGTFVGLNKFDGSNWTVYKTNNGLPANKILCVFVDESDIWIGTPRGAAKFDGENWMVFNIKNGLPHNIVLDIVKDKSGNIQIATKNGVAILKDSNFEVLNEASGLAKSCTHSIAIAENGTWYGAHDGKLTFYDGENFMTYKQGSGYYNPIPALVILDIMVLGNAVASASGEIMFGVLDIVLFTGIGYAIGFALPYKNNYTDLIVDNAGNLWFSASLGGFFKFDGENWTSFNPQNGLTKHKRITDIAQDANGNIWVSKFGGGISKFDNGNWTEYKKNNGLVNNKAFAVFVDSNENVWVGTRKGLVKMSM